MKLKQIKKFLIRNVDETTIEWKKHYSTKKWIRVNRKNNRLSISKFINGRDIRKLFNDFFYFEN